MAVAMSTKTRTKVDWKQLFPMQSLKTYSESSQFMKKLTKIGLSSIVFYRGIFPKECFTFSLCDDINLPIFNEKGGKPECKFFKDWLTSCYEAFDKKYLKTMTLGFFEDARDPSTLFEAYSFTFDYNNETVVISQDVEDASKPGQLSKKEETVKRATLHMLRSTIFTSTNVFDKLPPDFDMSMQLTYYEEYTPQSYHPKGFQPYHRNDATISEKVVFGRIASPFHRIKVVAFKKNLDINMRKTNNEPAGRSIEDNNSTAPEETPNYVFDCPCTLRENSEVFGIVQCIKCEMWQHAACFGILEDDKVTRSQHCCCKCISKYNIEHEYSNFLNLPAQKRKTLCIMRCALEYCSRYQRVNHSTFRELFLLSNKSTSLLVKSLSAKGIFRHVNRDHGDNQDEDSDTTYIINTHVLTSSVIPYYFIINNESVAGESTIPDDSDEEQNSPDILTQCNTTMDESNNVESSPIIPRRSNRKRRAVDHFTSPAPLKRASRSSSRSSKVSQ